MKFKSILLAVFVLTACAIVPSTAQATLTAADVHEINKMTPGSDKVSLGTKLRGLLYTDYIDLPADWDTIGVSKRLVLYTTSGTDDRQFPSLVDGYPGQLLTIVFKTKNTYNFEVTPDTKTGFTSITFDNAGDWATIQYVDDTTGWIPVGSGGNGSNKADFNP